MQGMLGTTLSEGRTLGPPPLGSYLQPLHHRHDRYFHSCQTSTNNCSHFLWPPLSFPLPQFPFLLPPPFLPPPTIPVATLDTDRRSLLNPESANLSRIGSNTAALKIHTNTEVTESLFAAGGYNTPPANSQFLPVSPYDLVAKNFHQAGSLAYSQANSIFVQSQTDYLSSTSAISKKTETCFGRWEHGTLEPLHIQVPPLQPVTSLTIKSESISCGSSRSSKLDELTPHSHTFHHQHQNPIPHHHQHQPYHTNVGGSHSDGLVTTMTTSSPTTLMHSSNDIINGCSRTIPIAWTASSSSSSSAGATSSSSAIPSSTSALLGIGASGSSTSSPYLTDSHAISSSAIPASSSSTSSSVTLLQIKREPCQVSEVTTSNNLGHHQHHYHQQHHQNHRTALTAVVKIESSSSPKSTVMDNHPLSASQSSAGAIPVGIAVARQRLQEHTTVSHQPKEINRFGIGLADIGGAASSLSQNMFFTGTNSTMIPLNPDALTMGVSNVQSAVRTPPTLWQYPTPVPVESMVPMPPVGFQLVRDPTTGQLLFLPTAATIEPFQQALVWPAYSQATAAIQPPHLLLPPLAQPPPLAPLQLLGSDYLATASTTLHQHTQTHSTRFVALTSDPKRKSATGPTVPLPIPHHALIKIEDCSSGSTTTTGAGTTTAHHHHHHQSAIFGEEKANSSMHSSAATITTAVQTNDIGSNLPTQLYYHQPSAGLIQIAPHHAQSNAIQECRSIAHESPPPLVIPPMLSSTPPVQVSTCLTPPPEQIISENVEAGSNCVPEVQDATIQTDTPIMSEDDNTTEECSYPINEVDEPRDEIIPSSTCLTDVCHNVSSNCLNEADLQESPQKQSEIDTSKNDSGFDSNAVTSTNSLEESSSHISEPWNYSSNQIEEEDQSVANVTTELASISEKEHDFKELTKVTSTPVDLSGLELLSNISIEAFEKKIPYIKQEPSELQHQQQQQSFLMPARTSDDVDEKCATLAPDQFSNTHEQLGGLNLLCALAEQRIQEEDGKRNRKRSSSSSDSHGSKRKKHKHSSGKKSSKKSRHDKEKKDRKRHRHSEDAEPVLASQEYDDDNDDVGKDMKETFNRVKAQYTKCATCKDDGSPHCCKDKCNWPTPEELISAMETDMRLRLADITRQCQKKKRELEEINPLLEARKNQLQSDRESTPLSSKNSISRSFNSDKRGSKFSCISPSLLSESLGGIELPKASSDTESSKFEDIETSSSSSSKRKNGTPKKHDEGNTETIVAKKPKSLVGYILASKNRNNENVKDKNVFDSAGFLTDDASVFSESSCKLRASVFKTEPPSTTTPIKQESFEDENSKHTPDSFSLFSDSSNFTPEKKFHKKSTKHHSKHKKSKSSKERKHKSSDLKEKKRKVDDKCLLTIDHLDKEKTRVLTAMGGLFYAGRLSALQPPDVYAVTLDGERGNRPHIMSREEVLRDAILEISPASVDEISAGTRLCAYWSQQYRCLYPGTAAEPGTPDSLNDKKFVSVEFDDGDSGRIALEDIRFLLSDYPIVVYDPNPLLSLGKRKRRISQANSESIPANKTEATPSTSQDKMDAYSDDHQERRKLKKMRKDRIKRIELEGGLDASTVNERKHKKKHKCTDEFCKHRKHKKRRKHKKHHHRETTPVVDSSQDADYSLDASVIDDEFLIEQDDSISQNGEPNEAETTDSKKESPCETDFDPNAKEDTMTEEEVASSITESSGSIYEPGKKKERQNSADNHSKIAAFLPARQLWGWSGKGYKRNGAKGRGKKQFYKTIQRGKEAITIGDSAVFLSTGRPDRPYIGRIESMWETSASNKVVRVKWFYHPEETLGCPNLKFPGALFESPHEDENDVQTISHKCEVLPLEPYTKKFGQDPKKYQSIYDNNDTYYLAGHYDPTAQNLKLQPDIPTLAENDKWA